MGNNRILKMSARLFEPVDAASLVFFRVPFGLIMLWHVSGYWPHVEELYLSPLIHFKYYGFGWAQVLPGDGMYYLIFLLGCSCFTRYIGTVLSDCNYPVLFWYYLCIPNHSSDLLKSCIFDLSSQFPFNFYPLSSVLFPGCYNFSQSTL